MKFLFAALALAAAAPLAAQTPMLPIPTRPAADVARDAARKPADMIAFAGIKPGMTVADFIPGGGYFTRVFSAAVGPNGHVIAVIPVAAAAAYPDDTKTINGMATNGYPNVSVVASPLDPAAAGKIDVFWTAQNYHDLHNSLPPEGVIGFNKAVFAALKPGGRYVIVDHAAVAGSGLEATKTLHRIDPAAVKAEVLAAGFVADGESTVLANSGDAHTALVFDPSVRGKTDQFVYRFRKP